MKAADSLLKSDKFVGFLEGLITKVCQAGAFFEDSDPSVCAGAVKEMGDIIVPSLVNSFLSPDYMCAEILSYCSSPTYTLLNASDFASDLLATKPE